MTPVTPAKPGEKTNLISSRISTLALGVNVGALMRPDAPRPMNPHNRRREENASPTGVSGGGFDATQDLARKMLMSQAIASDQELTHVLFHLI